MKYHIKKDCKKSSTEALGICKQILMPLNYRIIETTENSVLFEGGGMIQKGQNPLLGAKKITISISNESLELNSDLGGVVRTILFFLIFPPALIAVLGTIFYFQGMGTQAIKQAPFMLLPFLVALPLVYIVLKKRTEKALDTLAHNIINA